MHESPVEIHLVETNVAKIPSGLLVLRDFTGDSIEMFVQILSSSRRIFMPNSVGVDRINSSKNMPLNDRRYSVSIRRVTRKLYEHFQRRLDV